MNKKVSLGVTIALILVSITTAIAITMSVSMHEYNSLIEDLPNREQMYSSLSELDKKVRSKYFRLIDDNKLNSNIAEGYINGLDDEHSYFMTADEYVEFYNRIHGKMSGIGIRPELDEKTEAIFVADVDPNSPAAAAGLQKGDLIIKIADAEVNKDNYETMVKKLSGDKLSSVDITFKRGEEETTTGVMRGYSFKSVFYEAIGDIGYIKITSFYENTDVQFREALDALAKQNVKKLVFDVRNTSEGMMEYAASVIDIVVPLPSEGNKALAVAKDKNGEIVKTFTSDAKDLSGYSICVLINEGTKGPAELFACDLRDFDKAQLVGTTTAGNGTLQEIFTLSDGSAVMLTTAEIIPYKSESFNKGNGKEGGVVPDHEVILTKEQNAQLGTLSFDQDPQIQKAFELVNSDGSDVGASEG